MSRPDSFGSSDQPQRDAHRSCVADELNALCDAAVVLETVIQYTDNAVMAADLDGVNLLWNPAIEELTGWSAADAIGRRIDEVLPGTREQWLSDMRRIAASETATEREVRLVRKDGSVVRVAVTLAPLHDTQGFPCGLLAVAHSLTEDERFDSLRRDFADLVSTELRGPLTSVLGYAQLMSGSSVFEDPEERRLVSRALDERCTELTSLLDELMLLAGLIEADTALPRQSVDVCDLAGVIAERLNTRTSECDVALEPSSSSARVLVDRLRFEQALEGLMSAAVEGGPSPCVDVRVSESEGQALVEIGQSAGRRSTRGEPTPGPGLDSPDEAPARTSALRDGVRLRYAERFAEQHAGEVRSAWDRARGSSFVLRLPVAAVEGV